MSATGWKADASNRRPHRKSRLKKRPPTGSISKKRRTSAKNSNSAMRLKGLLPQRS